MQSDNWVAKKPPQKPSSEMVPVQFTESGQDATNMLGHDEQKMPGQGIFTKCRHRKWPRHKILAVKKHWTNFFTTTESDKRDNLRSPAVHGAGSVAKTAAQKLPRPKSELSSQRMDKKR